MVTLRRATPGGSAHHSWRVDARFLASQSERRGQAEWFIRIDVGEKDAIILEEWSYKEAARRARSLGATFGIQPRIDGEPLYVEMEAVPRPGTRWSSWKTIALTALIMVLAILAAAHRANRR